MMSNITSAVDTTGSVAGMSMENTPVGSSATMRSSAPVVKQPEQHEVTGTLWKPLPLVLAEVDSSFELGSLVEVDGNPLNCRYGVLRWIGYLRDKHKPIAGLEMVSNQ